MTTKVTTPVIVPLVAVEREEPYAYDPEKTYLSYRSCWPGVWIERSSFGCQIQFKLPDGADAAMMLTMREATTLLRSLAEVLDDFYR